MTLQLCSISTKFSSFFQHYQTGLKGCSGVLLLLHTYKQQSWCKCWASTVKFWSEPKALEWPGIPTTFCCRSVPFQHSTTVLSSLSTHVSSLFYSHFYMLKQCVLMYLLTYLKGLGGYVIHISLTHIPTLKSTTVDSEVAFQSITLFYWIEYWKCCCIS